MGRAVVPLVNSKTAGSSSAGAASRGFAAAASARNVLVEMALPLGQSREVLLIGDQQRLVKLGDHLPQLVTGKPVVERNERYARGSGREQQLRETRAIAPDEHHIPRVMPLEDCGPACGVAGELFEGDSARARVPRAMRSGWPDTAISSSSVRLNCGPIRFRDN